MEQAGKRTVNPQMTAEEINGILAMGGEVTFVPGVYENADYLLSCPVHIIGYGATLIGGKRVQWKEEKGMLTAEVDSELPIRVLRVGDSLRARCRMPESGYLSHVTDFDVRWMSTTGGGWQRKPTQKELTELCVPAHSLDDFNLDNAEATVVHSWDESLVRVAKKDGDRVIFAEPTGHPAGAFGNHHWCLWNVPEAFEKEGTFYHDVKAKKLYYRPLAGENVNTAAYIPTSVTIFRNEAPLENVEIEGFSFSVTDTYRGAAGFGAYNVGGVLELTNVKHCKFHHLTMKAIGGYGFRFLGTCAFLAVDHCDISNCGGGGIYIFCDKTEKIKSAVTDCVIHHIGFYYPSGIGIAASGVNVSHCELYHTSYSAMTCGGDDIVVEWNKIHDSMEVLNDGAAIYSFGVKNGTLRHNLVYGIQNSAEHKLRSAYYLDELCEGWLVEENVAVDCSFPNHNHMCGSHLYQKNIFTNSVGNMLMTVHNGRSANRYINNRYCANGTFTFEGTDNIIAEFSGNIIYDCDKTVHWIVTKAYDTIGEKTVEGGIFTDHPFFFTPDDRVFEVEGLKIDLNGVGVRK